jgi:excisionase family DNA binding protein
MAKDKDAPTLTTLQNAAEKHGVPYTSLRDLVLQGHLPSVKLGESRRIWVKNADVDRLIASSTERKKP